MSSCVFTKRGLKTVRWNKETGKDDIYLEPHPAIHINHYCEIEEGVTLKQIMNVVANDPPLSLIVSMYSDVQDIEGFHKELNSKKKTDTKLSHIEIYRSGQIYKKDLSVWTDWIGILKKKGKYGKEVGLSYVPLYKMANLPVKLKTDFKVWSMNEIKPEKPAIDYKTSFTLLEILHAIYYDISFHGGPKEREAIKKEMAETVDKILVEEFPCESES